MKTPKRIMKVPINTLWVMGSFNIRWPKKIPTKGFTYAYVPAFDAGHTDKRYI